MDGVLVDAVIGHMICDNYRIDLVIKSAFHYEHISRKESANSRMISIGLNRTFNLYLRIHITQDA